LKGIKLEEYYQLPKSQTEIPKNVKLSSDSLNDVAQLIAQTFTLSNIQDLLKDNYELIRI